MLTQFCEILRKAPAVCLAVSAFMTVSAGCSSHGSGSTDSDSVSQEETQALVEAAAAFSADSARGFLRTQVEFGPRVPGTAAHREAGDWIVSKMRGWCDTVIVQNFTPLTFDGHRLPARNIFGRFRPEAEKRVLLLAHWDCRPWADEDPDPAKRSLPVDGANDGASGVAVLMEIARVLAANAAVNGTDMPGIDILFVDAEDWGTDGDEDSWALGARYFAQNPPVKDYAPSEAILLDMVGGRDALFCKEYFSERSNPSLNARLWRTARRLGYGELFSDRPGGAVTDDHVQLIEAGIPSVDIIEYHPDSGFAPTWHTAADNLDNISAGTLEAVGRTTLQTILGHQ